MRIKGGENVRVKIVKLPNLKTNPLSAESAINEALKRLDKLYINDVKVNVSNALAFILYVERPLKKVKKHEEETE